MSENTIKTSSNLKEIHSIILKIKSKIDLTQDIHLKLNNKLLINDNPNSNLEFQINILKTEYIYYNSLNKLILEKFTQDFKSLLNDIIKTLSFLDKLEFEPIEKKKELTSKIIKYKEHTKVITYTSINEILEILNKNMPLINDYIQLFEEYIDNSKVNSTQGNIHNDMYVLNILYKNEKIKLEYKKYCETFETYINYFEKITTLFLTNIKNSEILKLCL